ncbi:MAG TPA: dienelactone hydrolase family protein [Chthoniobacterales bacterium]
MKKTRCLFFTAVFLLGLVSAPAMNAAIVEKPLTYEHDGVKLIGFLAYDDTKTAAGKPPGVLLIPEWWGLNDYVKSRTKQLAELGYVAFAADMYGDGQTTTDAGKAGQLAGQFYGKPLMPERAKAGLDALLKTGLVDESRLAAIGFCFGGSTVQTLAYAGAPVVGIVSFHGSPMAPPAGVAGKVKTRFLLLNGGADPLSTPADNAKVEKSLKAAKIDYQSVSYPGALHAFTNPGADELAAKNGLVGKIGYNDPAAKASWAAMQAFFGEIFRKN